MFGSILTSVLDLSSVSSFLLCTASSLACGTILAMVYRRIESSSRSFTMTVALLPVIVQTIILMVNGNLGVGVAVAGSFSLVRFRSIPGKASDILIIFASMGLGLCTGMGYAAFALANAILISAMYVVIAKTRFFQENPSDRSLRITIPEDLDYTTVFDDIFSKYTQKYHEEAVRTLNLGTMYQVTYRIRMKDAKKEKEMLDAIRVRNGNLPVLSSHASTFTDSL